MQNGLIIMQDGLPYLHPLVALLGVFLGSWLPAIVRTIQALSRPLYALARRF